ncbi:MAG: ATP-binding protein [Candidatus Hadarchaeales archaeon]
MKLRTLLEDQRAELEEKVRGTKVVEREFVHAARERARSGLAKVITGVRRAGKSFFTYLLLKDNFAYANFDDRLLSTAEHEQILSALLELYGQTKTIFLDEVQNLEGWELFVNRLLRGDYNVFVTGSSARLLSRELSTHLTGRHLPLEIFPFSFREYLVSLNFKEDLGTSRGQALARRALLDYLASGGFPEVVARGENPKLYLRQLFEDIVEKDIIARYKVRHDAAFREMARTLLAQVGKPVSFHRLKNLFGLGSDHTAKDYLLYLQEGYLLLPLSRFSFKPAEIERSFKKVYTVDPGFLTHVALLPSESLGDRLENLVAVELMRRKSYFRPGLELFYFRVNQGEVDFLLREGLRVVQLIQATFASSREEVEKREVKSLLEASELLDCRDLLVITWDYEGEEERDGKKIVFKPAWKWLLEIRSTG